MIQQYHLPLPHREAMGADDFMVTDSNREAFRWITEQSPAAWPGHCLILHGPDGCGKSHLLAIWQQKYRAQAVTSGMDIIGKIVNQNHDFTALIIDNADTITGQPVLEEWLQHLFNATKAANLPILLAARTPPQYWGLQLADIRSRLAAALTIGLQEPDDILLSGLLMKQFDDRQLRVELEVIEYLLKHMRRSAAAVRQLVELVDQQALEQKRKITVQLVKEILI